MARIHTRKKDAKCKAERNNKETGREDNFVRGEPNSFRGDPFMAMMSRDAGSDGLLRRSSESGKNGASFRGLSETTDSGGFALPETADRIESMRNSGGVPLENSTREFMESRMGHDFSDVRIHTGRDADTTSREMGARAYTIGTDIAFAKDQYNPESHEGKKLLAHELAHTIQQGGVRRKISDDNQVANGIQKHDGSHVETVQRFSTGGHREATVDSLAGSSFSSGEIGLIYQSNFERDLSQGPAILTDLLVHWKQLKMDAAGSQSGGLRRSSVAAFKKSMIDALSVVKMIKSFLDSPGGKPIDHMDNPGKSKKEIGNIPVHIHENLKYIEQHMLSAVEMYRTMKCKRAWSSGINTSGPSFASAPRPKDGDTKAYAGAQKFAGTRKTAFDSRMAISTHAAGEVEAKRRGKAGKNRNVRPEFYAAADQIGRASHALEDFFAHSNWIEKAADKSNTDKLTTGTFKTVDIVHALGDKLITVSERLLQDLGGSPRSIIAQVYPKVENKIRMWTAWGLLHGPSLTPVGHALELGVAFAMAHPSWFAHESFLNALKYKGEMMVNIVRRAPWRFLAGHGVLAKDSPEPADRKRHQKYRDAIARAESANTLIIAPLREIMDLPDHQEAQDRLLKTLHLLRAVVAPPGPTHPLVTPGAKIPPSPHINASQSPSDCIGALDLYQVKSANLLLTQDPFLWEQQLYESARRLPLAPGTAMLPARTKLVMIEKVPMDPANAKFNQTPAGTQNGTWDDTRWSLVRVQGSSLVGWVMQRGLKKAT